MTNEEAIKYTEKCIFATKDCIERHKKSGFPTGEMQETLEYYEIILKSLKSVSFLTAIQDNNFQNHTKMVPLTIEELREMDGKPVFLPKTNCWALATKDVFVMLLTFPDGEKCSANDWYKQVGPAYAYSFAHIDRAAWEPCGACKDGKITIHVPEFRAMAACNQHMDHGAFDLTLRLKFCPLCGRPLTEEAWAELEKRLRG